MPDANPLPIFLTGASRGIGAASAREFAKVGHPLALVARSADKLEALAQEIRGGGGRAIAIPCDVADPPAIARAVETALSALGGIGIVINNAGTLDPVGKVADIDPAAFGRAMAVNLTAPIAVMHYTVKHLPKGGIVLNVSSGWAEHPSAGRAAYCASKSGLTIATRVFSVEESAARGIRVMAFSPGLVDTEMNAHNRANAIGSSGNYGVDALRPPAETARILSYLIGPDAGDYDGKSVSANDPELRRRAGVPEINRLSRA